MTAGEPQGTEGEADPAQTNCQNWQRGNSPEQSQSTGQPVWLHGHPGEQGLCLLAMEGRTAGEELCFRMFSLGQYATWNTGVGRTWAGGMGS